MSRLLILDMMDTFVLDPFMRLFPSLCGMRLERLLELKDPDSWPQFELGEIDEAEYFRRFYRAETGMKLADPEGFKRQLFSSYTFIYGMERLLSRLKADGHLLWVHSNYSPWFEQIRIRLSLDRFFTGYVLSYQIGARKPSPLSYERALSLIGVAADACIFIDDRRINVESAQAAGMQSLLFQNAYDLARDLRELL